MPFQHQYICSYSDNDMPINVVTPLYAAQDEAWACLVRMAERYVRTGLKVRGFAFSATEATSPALFAQAFDAVTRAECHTEHYEFPCMHAHGV